MDDVGGGAITKWLLQDVERSTKCQGVRFEVEKKKTLLKVQHKNILAESTSFLLAKNYIYMGTLFFPPFFPLAV